MLTIAVKMCRWLAKSCRAVIYVGILEWRNIPKICYNTRIFLYKISRFLGIAKP